MSGSTFRFSGKGGVTVDEFVKNVTTRANAEGRQLDNKWNVEFVVTRLSGPALKWYEGLDKNVQGDWTKLRKALEETYGENKPSSPRKFPWRRGTGSRGPSRSNSLAESLNFENDASTSNTAPPSYTDATSGAKTPKPLFLNELTAALEEEVDLGRMDPAARRIRLISKTSGKEVGYVSRFPTASNWFGYTTNVSEAVHVKLGSDTSLEILNGPPSTQPPIVLTIGWSEDGRSPTKEAERYASLGYYEKNFGGFLQARDGWVAKWQSGPSSTIKALQKKALGFGTTAFTSSISERTKAIRLHSDLKTYKRRDPDAVEVEFVLEPVK